jgi:hypothetical protein
MRRQGTHFILILIISILVGIILPLATSSKPVDWKWFFYIMALGITLVWVVYSILLLGYVFLIEGRRNRNKLMMRKEEGPNPLHSTKELDALWEITAKRNRDPGMRNHSWN